MNKYSLYAYDPGDGLLSVSKEVDNKYGQWVKYEDVKTLLLLILEDLERSIEQQTKITPFIASYVKLKEALQ